jgi:hypothetical protein
LLAHTACICSLYLVLNVRPVCPLHFSGQSMCVLYNIQFQCFFFICYWICMYSVHYVVRACHFMFVRVAGDKFCGV